MIDAQDLRLGNWIYLNGVFTKVTGIELEVWLGEDLSTDLINHQIPNDCNPIPLSPEILYKAGFKGNSYGNFSIKIAEFAYLRISFKDYTCAQICETVTVADHDLDAPCKYLHHLQNLFYALSGTELIINL